MNKIIGVVALAAMVLTSCQSTSNKTEGNEATVITKDVVYKGTLPAADGPGIVYELTLKGDTAYTLDMTYLEAVSGRDTTFTAEGKLHKIQQGEKNAFKLESTGVEPAIYFVEVNDSVLRMSNDSLQAIESELNYDLTKVK